MCIIRLSSRIHANFGDSLTAKKMEESRWNSEERNVVEFERQEYRDIF